MKETNKLCEEVGMNINDIKQSKEAEIREKIRKWDENLCKDEIQKKRSITIYDRFKKEIKEVNYGNNERDKIIFRMR